MQVRTARWWGQTSFLSFGQRSLSMRRGTAQNSRVQTLGSKFRRILASFALAMMCWFLLACVLTWQIYLNEWRLDVHRPFLYYLRLPLLRFTSYAILTPPMFYIVRRFLITAETVIPRLLVYFISFPFFVLSYSLVRLALYPPYSPMTGQWGPRDLMSVYAIAMGTFADQVGVYFLIVSAAHAYEYFRRSQRQEAEKGDLQKALAASELAMLKMQLHPHFLFNTLHGIATLIERDAAAAKAMIVKVSSLLRIALKHDSADLVTLRDELEFVQAYLDLEKMRLGPRLQFRINVGEHTSFLFVPQLILQPLIENAIVHGVACCREGGWVEIGSRKSGGWLELYVQNSVGGHSEPGTGLGMENTRARLKHLYGGEATFQFSIWPNSTAEAVVRVPAFVSSFAPRRETLAVPDVAAGGA